MERKAQMQEYRGSPDQVLEYMRGLRPVVYHFFSFSLTTIIWRNERRRQSANLGLNMPFKDDTGLKSVVTIL